MSCPSNTGGNSKRTVIWITNLFTFSSGINEVEQSSSEEGVLPQNIHSSGIQIVSHGIDENVEEDFNSASHMPAEVETTPQFKNNNPKSNFKSNRYEETVYLKDTAGPLFSKAVVEPTTNTDKEMLVDGVQDEKKIVKYKETNVKSDALLGIESEIISKLLNQKSFEEFETHLGRLTEDEVEDVEQLLVWKSVVDSVSELKAKKKGRKREKRDEEVVCYSELGCYKDVGFFDYLDTLPQSPSEIGTR